MSQEMRLAFMFENHKRCVNEVYELRTQNFYIKSGVCMKTSFRFLTNIVIYMPVIYLTNNSNSYACNPRLQGKAKVGDFNLCKMFEMN